MTEEVVRHACHKPGAVCGTGSTFVPNLQGVGSELLPPKVQDDIVQELQDEAGAGHGPVAGRQAGVLQTLDQLGADYCSQKEEEVAGAVLDRVTVVAS